MNQLLLCLLTLSKRISFALFLLLTFFLGGHAYGQNATGTWALTSNASVVASGTASSTVTVGSMAIGTAFTGGAYNANGFDCQSATTWPTAVTSGYYLDFPFSPASGYDLAMNSFSVTFKTSNASNSNVVQFSYALDGSSTFTNFGSTITITSGGTDVVPTTAISGVSCTNGHTMIIRMNVYASGTVTSGRNFYVKSMVLNGTTTAAVAAAPTFTINPGNVTICAGNNTSFTGSATGATSYQWQRSTTGTGGTYANIDNTTDGGIYTNYTTGALNAAGVTATMNGYAYQLVATNITGSTTSTAAVLTVNATPAQPAAFTASTATVCQGQNTVTYTVPNDPTVVTYNWSFSGTGATVTGSTNSVTVSFSNTATSGTLSVTGTNTCGTSTARTIAITVNPLPSQPAAFTTSTSTVCQGQSTVTYTVPNDATVTYNWTYSGTGATITGSTNSVTVSFSNTATSGTLSVTATAINGCGTSTARTLAITVNPLPSQPAAFTTSTAIVCQGQSTVTYTVPNDATVTYNWSYSGTGATITGTSNSVTVSFSSTATSGTLSVTATATNGCGTSTAQTTAITVNPLPSQPAAFTASTSTVCQGQNTVTYTVPNDPTVTYNWTYSGTGATITGTSNSVTVSYSNTATSGTLSVTATATNGCGISTARTLAITVNPLPSQPAAFTTSTATVCQGQSSVTYTVPNDASVTYNWTYSGTGATITGSTNSVTVSYSSTATSGTLSVTATATNGCGTSAPRTIAVTVNPLPTQPAAFTISSATVCQGQSSVTYTVPNDPTVTYNWTYSGTGATITGSTNSVTVSFSSIATSGTLSVTATNSCSTSIARSVAITVNPLPNQPAAFTTSTTSVCQGQNSVTYTVPNDPTVTYNWSYSGTGATITGTTNSVTVSFSNTATSGTLNVTATAINGCGTSIAQGVSITVKALPNQPAAFTASTATVCQGQNTVTYTVPNDATVTYNWSYSGTGATITGTSNSVTVSYSTTATSGTLSVTATATNGCGISIARTLPITVNPLPNQPSAFTTSSLTVCQGQNSVTYTVPNDPTVTYNWSYTGTGATITGTTNSVTVSFSNTATSGTLNVTATNSCNTSIARSVAVTVNPLPNQPAAFSASSATVCQGQNNVTYAVPNDATVNYNWSYTGTGATITGAGNSVTISYSNTATSGTLNVTATAINGCGISAARSLAITVNPLPNQPAAFTTSTAIVCQGQSSVSYSIPNDPLVTYSWSYSGTGATITGTTNSVTVSYSSTATSGTLSVAAVAINGCGTSAARTIAITVNPLPNQPAAFTNSSATVCQGQSNVTYTVPNDPAVSYTWSYTGTGGFITATTNSASVNFSSTATSGTLNVTATALNGCGISAPRALAITVNLLPNQPAAFTAAPLVVCQGQNAVTYTVPNDPTVTYTWSYSGTGATITGTGNSVIVSFSTTATSGTLSVTATNSCSTSIARTTAITVNPLPNQPAAFTTSTLTVCQGQSNITYTVPLDATVTYNWSYTGTGATITGTGNSVTVSFSNTATGGTLNVTATAINGCGTSTARSISITVNPLPNQPAAFTSSTATVCQGQNNVIYSVPNDAAVTYSWTYSGTGATITGAGNSVNVSFSPTATSGTLSVTGTATNGCGISAARTIAITVNALPTQPAAFATGTATVCQGQSSVVYAVPNDPTVTYNWTFTGSGATITGTGSSATVSFSNTATSGTLNVTATAINGCGTSIARGFAITVNPLPVQPFAYTVFSSTVCQGQNNVTYTVPNDPTVTYNWTYTGGAGATITPTGNSATVSFSNTATSGTLNVTATAINGCGTSAARTIAITVNPLPAQPAVFSTSSPTVCQGQSNVIYTVPNDATVSYNWTYSGTGATITGTGNSVSINFSNTATSGTLSVTATAINGCGTSIARSQAVTVNLMPNVTVTPTSQPVCSGSATTPILFTGTIPLTTFSWTNTVPAIGISASGSGTNSIPATPVFNTGASPVTATITVTPSLNGCSGAPQTATITVNPLLTPSVTIAANPSNIICNGTPVTFTATTVNGGTSPIYQWKKNGINVGINSNTYTDAALTNGNSITATITSNATCATPTTATSAATVITADGAPVIATNPANTTVCETSLATFAITTANLIPVTVQWQVSINGGVSWSNINGATSTTYSFACSLTQNNYQYRAVCTDMCGNTTSTAATLTVNQLPVVTTQPQASTVCAGGNTQFSIQAIGTTLTYQWQVNAGSGFNNITNGGSYNGATTNTLVVTNAALSLNAVQYRCIASGACLPAATSASAVFTVNPNPASVITANGAVNFCSADSVTLTVGSGAGLTYQWQVNGGPINNATTPSYVVHSSGNYTVQVTNGFNCKTTSTITPVVVTQVPLAQVYNMGGFLDHCVGDSVILGTLNIGQNYTYQWLLNGNPIPAATTPMYSAIGAGSYNVIVTNGACINTTPTIAVSVKALPANSSIIYTSKVICPGSSVTLSIVQDPTLTYLWYVNGHQLAGDTATQYNFSAAGSYSVKITNNLGCSVYTPLVPVSPGTTPVPMVTVNGTTGLISTVFNTYQWYLNGNAITNATGQTYTPAITGGYNVSVTDSNGCTGMSATYYYNTVSINNVSLTPANIKLYPNPATSVVHINAPEKVNVSLCSLDGKQLMYIIDASTIDISKLSNAVYLIKVYDMHDSLIKIEKLVKTGW